MTLMMIPIVLQEPLLQEVMQSLLLLCLLSQSLLKDLASLMSSAQIVAFLFYTSCPLPLVIGQLYRDQNPSTSAINICNSYYFIQTSQLCVLLIKCSLYSALVTLLTLRKQNESFDDRSLLAGNPGIKIFANWKLRLKSPHK